MQTRDSAAWEEAQPSDEFLLAIYQFAEKWGEKAETELELDNPNFSTIIVDCGKSAAEEIMQSRGSNVTLYMYRKAVELLVEHWVHGHALKVWFDADGMQDGIMHGMRAILNYE